MSQTTHLKLDDIDYPESDGAPMTESDPTRDYLIYGVEALSIYFQDRQDVYVSGNLFIYYKRGVPDAVVSPDVFVIFGVEKKKRRSYKAWEEGNKLPSFILEITSKTTQENDEEDKPKKYQKMGVLEYFQYDPTGDYLPNQLKGSRLINGKYQPLSSILLEESVSFYSDTLGLDLRLVDGKLRFFDPQTNQKLLSHLETKEQLQQTEQQLQQEVQARQQAELALQHETQGRQVAIRRLIQMGLSVEQIAEALGLSVELVSQLLE